MIPGALLKVCCFTTFVSWVKSNPVVSTLGHTKYKKLKWNKKGINLCKTKPTKKKKSFRVLYTQKLLNSHKLWDVLVINLCPFLNNLPKWKKDTYPNTFYNKETIISCELISYLKLALLPEFMVNCFIFQQREWAGVTRKAHDLVAVTRHFWALLARDVISSSLAARNGALACMHKKKKPRNPANTQQRVNHSLTHLSPLLSSSALLPGQRVNPKFLILVQVLELDLCSHWVQGKRY